MLVLVHMDICQHFLASSRYYVKISGEKNYCSSDQSSRIEVRIPAPQESVKFSIPLFCLCEAGMMLKVKPKSGGWTEL